MIKGVMFHKHDKKNYFFSLSKVFCSWDPKLTINLLWFLAIEIATYSMNHIAKLKKIITCLRFLDNVSNKKNFADFSFISESILLSWDKLMLKLYSKAFTTQITLQKQISVKLKFQKVKSLKKCYPKLENFWYHFKVLDGKNQYLHVNQLLF